MNISINSDFHDGTCFITLHGRLDSANAAEAQEILLQKAGEHPGLGRLSLDVADLKYISSAGLRILLLLKSTIPDIVIINASPVIFRTLEITGFTKLFHVQKAFRNVDITGCSLIALGLTSRVYKLDSTTVIKVYPENADFADICREQETVQKAFVLGIPAAISYEIVKVEQQYGIAYKMSDAKCLSLLISEQPDELSGYAEKLATLARTIHFTRVSDGQFQTARSIYLPMMSSVSVWMTQKQYDHISKLTEAVPDTDTLIHGGFHPNSVLVHDGRFELIDMGNVSIGYAPLDLLSLYGISGKDKNPAEISEYFGMSPESRSKLWSAFCQAYFADSFTPDNMRLLHEYLDIISLMRTVSDKCRLYGTPKTCPESKVPELRRQIEKLLQYDPEDVHNKAIRISSFLPRP